MVVRTQESTVLYHLHDAVHSHSAFNNFYRKMANKCHWNQWEVHRYFILDSIHCTHCSALSSTSFSLWSNLDVSEPSYNAPLFLLQLYRPSSLPRVNFFCCILYGYDDDFNKISEACGATEPLGSCMDLYFRRRCIGRYTKCEGCVGR
jgi:hypothetical protein